ncbi:EscU/YscU/HrcU family type III secretion system export apparatus switch protein [Aliiroseovarius sp. PTFE2010]|uniref:EscU/YscU/HrcU family type III secretion system export apparatus switch protein n=1 Tax=Aliiroseovarius sp. PTFE2010 TaxID=3417190 RepID=UPI003CFB63EF
MAEGEDEDKQYEPSQKKLDDARKKGEVPRSTDLTTAAAYGGFIIAAAALGQSSMMSLGSVLQGLVGKADSAAQLMFEGSGQVLAGGIMLDVLWAIAPLFLIPALFALVSTIAQKSFVVAPQKLAPKLSRISVLSNAKNKFGRSGLFEFAKSFFKLSIYGLVLGVYLWTKIPQILATLSLSPGMVTVVLLKLVMNFLLIVLAIAGAIGAVDFLWQYSEHMRKNRMSRKEMTDEQKQAEGDPHVKQQRRQRGYEIAMNQMLADVPTADVIVVNPEHYAVALKWDRGAGSAPVCVAKGVDEIAARIRELANENGIPIHRDPPTARALHASVEIGQEIHPEHYAAVAAAIRFAEDMRKKMGHTVRGFR